MTRLRRMMYSPWRHNVRLPRSGCKLIVIQVEGPVWSSLLASAALQHFLLPCILKCKHPAAIIREQQQALAPVTQKHFTTTVYQNDYLDIAFFKDMLRECASDILRIDLYRPKLKTAIKKSTRLHTRSHNKLWSSSMQYGSRCSRNLSVGPDLVNFLSWELENCQKHRPHVCPKVRDLSTGSLAD